MKQPLLFLIGLLAPFVLRAQDPRQRLEQQAPLTEKMYLHTDRTFYVVGESIWFRLYYVDGTNHKPLDISKVAYVELLDKGQTPVLQAKIALHNGRGNGMLLLPSALASGNYTLRAYTQWMKNFGAEFFFSKTVTVANTFTKVPATAPEKELELTFFPEGGNLVAGLPGRVAFRGIDERGKGVDLSGSVVNQRNETVASFRTERFGLGSFDLTPVAGDTYRAVIAGRGEYPLPATQTYGYALRLQPGENGSAQVEITSTADRNGYLLVHTRRKVGYAQPVSFPGGKAAVSIPAAALGEGISHLTFFDAAQRPVCERLIFRKPRRRLTIDAKSNKQVYNTRDKVLLDLAADSASLSVAVYRLDSLQQPESEDIASYLWMRSDLKGTVEASSYYLDAPESAADLVMLTHGWSRFRWDDKPFEPTYLPEIDEHVVTGKVLTADGRPAADEPAFLAAPGRHVWLYTALSDKNGKVFFPMKHFAGPNEIVAATGDTLKRIELQSPFAEARSDDKVPPMVFDKNLADPLLERSLSMQTFNAFFQPYAPVQRTDTVAFYGIADKTYFLDDYTRFPLLEEVMREYVPEVDVRRHRGRFSFLMVFRGQYEFTRPPLVLLDGVPVQDINRLLAIDPLKIRRLDVVNTRYFLGPLTFDGIVSFRSYKGDVAGFQPEGLVTSYEGVQNRREFYAPRYDAKEQRDNRLADFRHLLHWVPEAGGRQQLNFYTGDLEGTYEVDIQGLSESGAPGSRRLTFEVKKQL
ncbi:hypothetical protein [Siphonobacter aquaeclarae]|uniref:MG2 domain-containing protein n=1 Tax=Siphonobacter aquaeclarae TaxID=563176 RepID=A0A1G9KV07_9BACT|nr:hypothetical protein [Siphonobacter aquaeclarae]SDL53522.1 hypothetical protein SAMN04488090_1146 [Siphonobacter aquaeclarae]